MAGAKIIVMIVFGMRSVIASVEGAPKQFSDLETVNFIIKLNFIDAQMYHLINQISFGGP